MEFSDMVRTISQESVEALLEKSGFEPTGQDDGDRDWLIQLERGGELELE